MLLKEPQKVISDYYKIFLYISSFYETKIHIFHFLIKKGNCLSNNMYVNVFIRNIIILICKIKERKDFEIKHIKL